MNKGSQISQELAETQETQQSQLIEEFDSQFEEEEYWGHLVQVGSNGNGRLKLVNDSYSIGRNDSNCIIIKDKKISGLHFRIVLEKGKTHNIPIIYDESSHGTFLNGERIGKKKHRSLQQSDKITLVTDDSSEWIFYFFQDTNDHKLDVNNEEIEHPELSKKYNIIGHLGLGSSSSVKLVISSGSLYAVKMISKQSYLPETGTISNVEKEIDVMKKINHSNIIEFHEVIITDKWIYIILEYASGSDLQRYIHNKQGSLPVKTAVCIFQQILEGLEYLHSNNIIHRDLKPDNILITSISPLVAKLSDFGAAMILSDTNTFNVCGTPNFMAPEVHSCNETENGYNTKVDMWSAGVLLYYILSGEYPFEDNIMSVKEKVLQGTFEYSSDIWDDIDDKVKFLIDGLLSMNPDERWSASKALKYLKEEIIQLPTPKVTSLLKKRATFDFDDDLELQPKTKKQRTSIDVIDLS